MSKKITITLSDRAEQYFYDRMYSDTKDDGATPCSQSECINHCLESLADFENLTDNQLEGWVADFVKLEGEDAKKFAASPTRENQYWVVAREALKKNQEIRSAFIEGHKQGWIRGANGHSGWPSADADIFMKEYASQPQGVDELQVTNNKPSSSDELVSYDGGLTWRRNREGHKNKGNF